MLRWLPQWLHSLTSFVAQMPEVMSSQVTTNFHQPETLRAKGSPPFSKLCYQGAMSWSPDTRHTLWRNTACINEDLIFSLSLSSREIDSIMSERHYTTRRKTIQH